MLVAAHAQELVDLDAAAVVERDAELAQQRVRAHAGRPHERARRDARAVPEDGLLAGDRLERRADVDLDAALRELARGVVAEPRRDLRQDLRRRVDEHPPPRDAGGAAGSSGPRPRRGRRARRAPRRPRSPAPTKTNVSRRSALGVVERGVRGLELAQDVVAQVDRVGERLEREPVLRQARHRATRGHRAEREHELAPAHGLRADVRLDLRGPRLEVDPGRAAEQKLRVRAHHAQRHDRVPRLERSGRRLGQQRRVEHEVLGADDRRAALAEQPRDVRAGEAAAEDQHAAACFALVHRISSSIPADVHRPPGNAEAAPFPSALPLGAAGLRRARP